MKFEKRNFMGIELDVLVGHPEYRMLFIATQVARAAGLKNPSHAVGNWRRCLDEPVGLSLLDAIGTYHSVIGFVPASGSGRSYTVMLDDSATYRMLLAGHAPASEPFRKWVTGEVLPSIHETGKYNAEDSKNPIAQGIMDRLMSLEGVVLKQNETLEALRQELQAKTFSLVAPAAEVSPYEGQPGVALCDPAGFNLRTYRIRTMNS